MNSHLNIYKTYTKTNRSYQLENDLTRALAICFQEDTLFFHEVLKEIIKPENYNQIFESLETEISVLIDIQKQASLISNFDHIFAISLSETEISDFWAQSYNKEYDTISDIVIKINNIVLVFEAKRDDVDCTAQLYNQILNIVKHNYQEDFNQNDFMDKVTPVDLNWSRLMGIAVKVLNFEKSMGNQNRFLTDFIQLVKNHNFRWLPESSISALQPENKTAIEKRIESAVEELVKGEDAISRLNYNDRLGVDFPLPWAQEVLFDIGSNGDLIALIYPGNTKAQGYSLFNHDPEFNASANIFNETYPIEKRYHIKFTSFQKYFTGLWFNESQLKDKLYTSENFHKYTGRKKRGEQWNELEHLFNNHLNFDWRKQCKWDTILASGKSQFDISFGYELCMRIPFETLKSIDTQQSNLDLLVTLLKEIHLVFCNQLIKTKESSLTC